MDKTDKPAGKHPSHDTRSSDASTYDEVCKNCGATDQVPGGWGKLAEPCPDKPADAGVTDEDAQRALRFYGFKEWADLNYWGSVGDRAKVATLAKEFAEARQASIAQHEAERGEAVAWRVDDLTAKGATCDSFTIFTDHEKVSEYVRKNGYRYTKVTPFYAHPPATRPEQFAESAKGSRVDVMGEEGIDLMGASWALENKIVNANGALANPDWVPDRCHMEGMRNTMQEAMAYIADARGHLSILQSERDAAVAEVARLREALGAAEQALAAVDGAHDLPAMAAARPKVGPALNAVRAALNEQPGGEDV